jgi:GT2 family glycosyltransferase
MDDWDHKTTSIVDHVIGAFYLIRKSVFNTLHGFDDRFFVYLEDLDLSLRAHKSGWRIVYLANAQAFHSGGGTSQQVKALRLFYALRSKIFYGFKHFSPFQAWLLFFVSIWVEPISRIALLCLRGEFVEIRNTINAYVVLYKNLPIILKNACVK